MNCIYKTFIILLLTIISVGCKKKDKLQEFSLNQPSKSYQELKELALTNGDTIAYHEMSIAYMDSPNDDRFLYTALIMANKHNYHLAYEDVYYVLTDYYHKKELTELEELDPVTRKMALDYLIKGDKKGSIECKRILGNHYLEGKYIEKDTIKGKLLIEESNR